MTERKRMTQEEKRQKIAEACGWTSGEDPDYPWVNPTTVKWTKPLNWRTLPDYFNDLNACHEMEKALEMGSLWAYRLNLQYQKGLGGNNHWKIFHANASQRAECFGITLGLWKEGE